LHYFVFGNEVFQQEAQNCLQITSLSNLLVLDRTNLRIHFRVGESEVSNYLADRVACLLSLQPLCSSGRTYPNHIAQCLVRQGR